VGNGSIGIVYALIFKRAGAEVVCLCRSSYAEASANGFTVDSDLFGTETFHPTIVSSIDATAANHEPYDFIVVCTKSFPGSQQQLVDSLEPVITDSTVIALLQNGIGVEKDYRERYPHQPIVSGVIYMPVTKTSAVSVKHTEIEKLFLGAHPSTASAVHAENLASIFHAGGATAYVPEDIQGERWKKVLVNGAWNPICALSRCRDVQFLQTSPIASLVVQGTMREICLVAAACGYSKYANEDTIDFQLSRASVRAYPGVAPSMMADMMDERPMEVEAILGGVLESARERGIETPRLGMLYALLSGLNSGFKADN
jgi:2-dehydropantoate 2-reductase